MTSFNPCERKGLVGVLVPFALLLYLSLLFTFYPQHNDINWPIVASKAGVAFFIIISLFVVESICERDSVHYPMVVGFILLALASATDLADQYLLLPPMLALVGEDLLVVVGFALLLAGLWRWNHSNRELHQSLRDLAVTDYLTGALNRRGFDAKVKEEVKRTKRYNSPLSLITFDLDNFKSINDQFGHDTGDEVLVRCSETIFSCMRDVDIFARTGGEEFSILIPATAIGGALDMAEKLREAMEKARFPRNMKVTASFGVGELFPEESFPQLMHRVDQALYEAKYRGKNCVTSASADSGRRH